MKRTICGVAGRSGGHIIPCLNHIQVLLEHDLEQQVLFFSTDTTLDKNIVSKASFVTKHVALPLENVPYKKWWRLPFLISGLFISLIKTTYFLIKYRPDLIISTGGYVSLPVCLIARLLSIRVELFELNVIPGQATKALAPFASTVRICFPETKKYLKTDNCLISPYPLRAAYKKALPTKDLALKFLDLSAHKKTILVLGGSQGSHSLNRLIPRALKEYPSATRELQIIHQAGNDNLEEIISLYQQLGIKAKVFSFHDHIQQLYAATDVVICRSGAGTLFETLHFKKRCITIPLKADTTTHQIDNAYSFTQQYPDLFSMIEQHELETHPNLLVAQLKTSSNQPNAQLAPVAR